MTDAIRNIDAVISNMSQKCRIIYFKSERRDIIRRVVDESAALTEKLEKRCGIFIPTGGSRYDWMIQERKCFRFVGIYKQDGIRGGIALPEDINPALLYITDFQIYDEQKRNFMLQTFLDNPRLRNCFLLIASPELHIPDGFGDYIELIQDKYITRNDIALKLTKDIRAEEVKRKKNFFSDEQIDRLAQDFVGLSESQVEAILERMNGVLCTWLQNNRHLELITEEKKKEIAKDPTVRFRETPDKETVCGLDNYTNWLKARKDDFQHPLTAKNEGTPAPKGVLLCGVPGTGKSVAARETARVLGVPLIQFEISRIQTKNFGGSEEKLRRYLDRISAFGSCVMLMDEIEKVFAVNESTHEVKRSMLSLLLDWMQTREANVFTFITANDISSLPPELIRDGRISGRFFAFMPSRDDLCSILQLKLKSLVAAKLFNEQFAVLIQNNLAPGNPLAKMFDDIAEEAKKTQRNLFMTGANLEVLVEMTNRKMRSITKPPYKMDLYLKTMKECALSNDFVPQGQSNMEDIVQMWLAAQKRQYQDVSARGVLPFNKYRDGQFDEMPKANVYDQYLRDVLIKRINAINEEKKAQESFMKKHG